MNVRVLDLSRVLAGPWAAQQLADQGAEVIKVEPPGGDETRHFGPIVDGVSTYHLAINRNKRTLVLDLKTPEGQKIVQQLAVASDVILENFRPGVAARLGVDYEQLRKVHPRLIYVAIHAFGDEGDLEWTARPGYDLALQALGGGASITGRPGDPPLKSGLSIADTITGLLAVQATLFALLDRERTGLGQRVVVNMMHAQAAALSYHASRYAVTGEVEHPRGNAHRGLCPYDLYRAADGWFAVACGNDGIWSRLQAALHLEERAGWETNLGRLSDRAAVDAAVGEVVGRRSVAELDALFAAHGIPGGPVQTIDQVVTHPQVERITLDHPVLGPVRVPGPFLTTRTTRSEHTPPHDLAADRDAILAELGYDRDAIEEMASAGAFG